MKEKCIRKTIAVNWDDHLDEKYGLQGTPAREKYEEEFEAFKIAMLIQEARKSKT
jgi:hypothetical protein